MGIENLTSVIRNFSGRRVDMSGGGGRVDNTPRVSLGSFNYGNQYGGMILNNPSSTSKRKECGYRNSPSGNVSENYLITITNRDWIVKAMLQEDITKRIESNWKPLEDLMPPGAKQNIEMGNVILQTLTKKSLVSAFTSRRIWSGTTPVELSLTLRFEAYYDEINEVTEPCVALQEMCLPDKGKEKGWLGILPLLEPPGPSPSDLTDTPFNALASTGVGQHLGKGDRILVQIGNLLTFDSVIVHSVVVTEHNRMPESGKPVSATVMLNLQTYEILTKDKLRTAYGMAQRGA